MIKEAFDNKRAEFGEVKFSSTSLNDPHVKKIIAAIVAKGGVTEKEILDDIADKMKKFDDIAKKSPILYETIQKNAIEQEIFDLLEKHDVAQTAPKFKLSVFNALIRRIKAEHDQFFPLRNVIDSKYLYQAVIIMVPNNKPEFEQFNSVTTAAATAAGQFIFCVPFMQKLLDYAHLKGLSPKGKKYVSNGGDIPDEYAYIEFLIIHEFMHYTYADFHYQKKLKANAKVINWTGDFRSNYLLVKSGFEQLPIGLFSDHVNYDRQNSYREMYEVVKAEFDKLSKDQQDKVQDAMDQLGDDHDQSEPGDGEPEKGAGSGSDDKNDKNKDGNGNKGSGGEPDDSDDGGDVFDELDKNHKEIEKKLGNGKEIEKEADEPKAPEKPKSTGKNGGTGKQGKDSDGSSFDYSKIRPMFTWKKLLNKMVTDVSANSEETFQKPHRRNITGVHLAQQTGSAAMKPGEIPAESEIKLCFVVDSSGSMGDVIAKVYANMHALMKSKSNINKGDFFLIKFSNTHHIYKCSFTKDRYKELSSIVDKSKEEKTGSVKDLFSSHFGAGTYFGAEMVREISQLSNKKYNTLIMSDSDILHGDNFENVKKLLVENKNVFIILDSRSTFIQMTKMMKQVSKNITYFE